MPSSISYDQVMAWIHRFADVTIEQREELTRLDTAIGDADHGTNMARGINITRNLVGDYITSLEMAGCSITLLKMDDDLTRLWDAPVLTPALRWGA